MAVVFSMPSSCVDQEVRKPADPLKFGERFTAVCKVGEGGGDGTLIAPDWVLTAAHVAEGMHQRSNGGLMVFFDKGKKIGVRNIFLHPGYRPMGAYDIALLKLDRSVRGVEPVPCSNGDIPIGQQIIIAGHGDRRNGDGTWVRDGRLRAYTNTIDSTDALHIFFDLDPPGPDATGLEGVSGPGDSGPAFIERAGRLMVAGISSMAESGSDGPASYGTVEHFVRVPAHIDWIESVMRAPMDHVQLKERNISKDESPAVMEIDPARNSAIQMIAVAFVSNDRGKIQEAIASTYDPAILARRDAATIMRNMPMLIEQLSGGQYMNIMAVEDHIVSLRFEKGDRTYQLDIFFQPSHKIEQMAFRQL